MNLKDNITILKFNFPQVVFLGNFVKRGMEIFLLLDLRREKIPVLRLEKK